MEKIKAISLTHNTYLSDELSRLLQYLLEKADGGGQTAMKTTPLLSSSMTPCGMALAFMGTSIMRLSKLACDHKHCVEPKFP